MGQLQFRAEKIGEFDRNGKDIHASGERCFRVRVGVFQVEGDEKKLIGSYDRNYSALFRTFWHFKLRGKHLALYGRNYTATRIMEVTP